MSQKTNSPTSDTSSYTIGQLSKVSGLSRSTLLYYHRKGLLTPSGRNQSNYRLYSGADYLRLEKIMAYRQTGMSLEGIQQALDLESHPAENQQARLLEEQLQQLSREIQHLRKQQQTTLELLQQQQRHQHQFVQTSLLNKQQWSALLSAAGMTDADMWQWHKEFERQQPLAHQDFLESLGIDAEEIKRIRNKSRQD